MKSPKPGADGIYNIISHSGFLYRNLGYEMRGWYRFCSGGVIAGVSSYRRHGVRNHPVLRKRFDMDLTQMEIPSKVYSHSEYWDKVSYRSGGSHFDLPAEYLYDRLLEVIYDKWVDGTGGVDMWAGNRMTAKTFGIADKVVDRPNTVTCHGFGVYLDKLAEQGIVRTTKLTEVDGAHGGLCTTWLAAIIEDPTREYLDGKVDKLNAHLDYLREYKKYVADKYAEEVYRAATENELIHDMWGDE